MVVKRNQFTFYRSYWEAMKNLSKRDRQVILEAVITYALDGQITVGMSSTQQAMFSLIKPTLDSGRRKAKYGKLGGKAHAAGAHSDADSDADWDTNPASQLRSKRENEVEDKVEKEVDVETEYESMDFGDFWQAYPVKIGEDEARAAWEQVKPEPGQVLRALAEWKNSEQWRKDGGRYIPRGAKFLLSGYWRQPPRQADTGPAPRVLDADEQAAVRRMMMEEDDKNAGTP